MCMVKICICVFLRHVKAENFYNTEILQFMIFRNFCLGFFLGFLITSFFFFSLKDVFSVPQIIADKPEGFGL